MKRKETYLNEKRRLATKVKVIGAMVPKAALHRSHDGGRRTASAHLLEGDMYKKKTPKPE